MKFRLFSIFWILGFLFVWTTGSIEGQGFPPSDDNTEEDETIDYIPCGTTVNMEEDHKYYFKTQKYQGSTPPYTYHGGYRTTSYYKRSACLWTFVSSDRCHLMVHFEDYYVGDRPCSVQYVSVGDHQTNMKACGYNTLPLAFESTSNFIVVKHYRRPVTKYLTQFEGFAICHSIGTGYEEPANISEPSYYDPGQPQKNVTSRPYYPPPPPQYSNNEPYNPPTIYKQTDPPSYDYPVTTYAVQATNYSNYNNSPYAPPHHQPPTNYENYQPAASGYQPPPSYQVPPVYNNPSNSNYGSPDPYHSGPVDYYPPSGSDYVDPSGPAHYAPYDPKPVDYPPQNYPPGLPPPVQPPQPPQPPMATTMGSGQETTPSIPNVPR